MKVVRLAVRNFKRFGNVVLDFTDRITGEPEPLVLIRGSNGSGKTTLLQAISAMLGVATGALTTLKDLKWPGYRFDLASDAWSGPAELELTVQFDQAELDATERCWEKLYRYEPDLGVRPAKQKRVTLRKVGDKVIADEPAQLFQFHARNYASRLWTHDRNLPDPFFEVGMSTSYHVYREPIQTRKRRSKAETNDKLTPYQAVWDEDSFRQELTRFENRHLKIKHKKDMRDYFLELQSVYQKVFPGRRIEGGEIAQRGVESLFYFHDGAHRYELAELSGGEKAILPILYDFIIYNINWSVVMIDEIELHLNPMIHQAFVRSLKTLGHENQFIFTSHSRQVHTVMSTGKIIDLDSL